MAKRRQLRNLRKLSLVLGRPFKNRRFMDESPKLQGRIYALFERPT